MKSFCLLISLILALPVLAKTSESMPDYAISRSYRDKAVKATQSRVILTVFNEYNKTMSGTLQAGFNSYSFSGKLDNKGQITYTGKPGKYRMKFLIDVNHFEIFTDSITLKPGYTTLIALYFKSSVYPVTVDKPVIYLYSEKNLQANIFVEPKNKLSFSYPAYENGWKVDLKPGQLPSVNGKKYPYLFWESVMELNSQEINLNEGYVVKRDSLLHFLEAQLEMMGFNETEKTDFITYWGPKMIQHPSCYIHFLFNDECNIISQLNIQPKPDHQYRVYMIWTGLSADISLRPALQSIPMLQRNGFQVLEWGGAEIRTGTNWSKQLARLYPFEN